MRVNGWSRKALIALPHREWQDDSAIYDSLLVFSNRTKHDSGWSHMVVIGCNEQTPVEICGVCADDLDWVFPPAKTYGSANDRFQVGQIRMDCTFPAGILHVWSRSNRFRVGAALSSVTINVIPAEPTP